MDRYDFLVMFYTARFSSVEAWSNTLSTSPSLTYFLKNVNLPNPFVISPLKIPTFCLRAAFNENDHGDSDYNNDEESPSGEPFCNDEELFKAIFDRNNDLNDENITMVLKSSVGASKPRPELEPEEIPPLLMTALQNNDFPEVNSGISTMWDFAGVTTKFIFKNNVTEYIESCHETADCFPTSFFGMALNGLSWEIVSPINRVGSEDGWIATQILKTISSDGRLRLWQWELRKNKRPPCLGCWFVESIGSSDRNGSFEVE